MKYKILLSASSFLLFLCKVYAQNPVTPEALSKMMLDYYNFTLVGSQTPTTGFKVETNKPSITLKGNIYSSNYRRFVTNIELEGGVDNGLMQLVSGKDVNTYFKGSLGFNFLLPGNIASHYVLTPTEYQLTNNAFTNNKLLLARHLDTFLIIKVITDDPNFQTYNFQNFRDAVVTEGNLPKYQISNFTRQYRPDQNTHYSNLIRGILAGYGTVVNANDDTLLTNFKTALSNQTNTSIQSKKILEDYDRIKDNLFKEKYTLNDKQYDFEIALTKVNWTWKKIRWWNISLAALNSNFKLYYPSNNKLIDSSSFLPAISISYNWLFKGKEPSKFHYIRGGVTIQKTNSLVDLQKLNYKKETTLTVTPGEELKSTKEGIAYQGELTEKTGFDLFIEAYSVPWNNQFIPGFYFKSTYRNSKAWINENKIALDLGMVWNVTNNDKDAKNLLSIIPYISWANLMKEYKDISKTEEKKLADLFSFNVKFGVPIKS